MADSEFRETLAIFVYLVDKYDKDHKLSSTGKDKYVELQWLAFQASGQGYVPPPPPMHFTHL
jgi:glutathione S-transferase